VNTLVPLLRRYWRELLVAILISAPPLMLVMLGGLWLLQNAWWPYWSLGFIVLTVLPLYALPAFWKPRAHGVAIRDTDPQAPSAETAARAELQRLLHQVSADDLATDQAVRQLLLRTINAVAGAYRPQDADERLGETVTHAALGFAVPELLLMTEELTRDLRATLLKRFPVAQHIELGWAMRMVDLQKEYRHWHGFLRLARWVNPATAIVSEVRSLVTARALKALGGPVKAEIAAVLVRETGEAAIKLYSGHYRRKRVTQSPPPPAEPPEPLRLLVAGRLNAGKSSLVNALLGIDRLAVGLTHPSRLNIAHTLKGTDTTGDVILIDSPGVQDPNDLAWLGEVRRCHLLLWVIAAHRADLQADRHALEAVRAIAQQDARLSQIPVVLVITHADRLEPMQEWQPPYDPWQGQRPKERMMHDVLEYFCDTLGITRERAVCVALAAEHPAWNLQALWSSVDQALPQARRKQLEQATRRDGWIKIVADSVGSAGGLIDAAQVMVKSRLERAPWFHDP
jgi:predicted GTPase